MTRPAPTRYRTLNWRSYNAALRERGSLTVWFDPAMNWHAEPSGRRGGQTIYSDAAIQACLTIKVLFGLPLRQTTGFVASLLKLAGLDWPVWTGRSGLAGLDWPVWTGRCRTTRRCAAGSGP